MAETNNKKLLKLPGWLRFPFGIKLTLIVSLILLGSIWIVNSLMAFIVSSELVRTAETSNFSANSRAASGIEERIYKIRSEALFLLDVYADMEENNPMARQIRNLYFERNPAIAAIVIPGTRQIINTFFLVNNEITEEALNAWLSGEAASLERAKTGEPIIKNVTPQFGIYLLALFYPWQNAGIEEAAVVFFSPQNLLEITGDSTSTTLVVNGEGEILISPDYNQILNGEKITGNALFDALWKSPVESISIRFTEEGNRLIGAGHQVSIAAAAVLSFREYGIINEQITATTRRNFLLSVTVLFLTILVTWFFSKTITNPLKKFQSAMGRLEQGEFDIKMIHNSRDEFGSLTEKFNDMGHALSEWQEARNLVGRFNKADLVNKVKNGEIKLEGEYFNAVVLSANLISFADNPDRIDAAMSLDLLNLFISRLTENVVKTGGIADIRPGSRVIALWGVPSSTGSITEEVINSLHTVQEMRSILREINSEREAEGKSTLRMSCGIHNGEVLAGRIGSGPYYEYAFAGKTVDDAVNCEEACDSVKLDIILSETVRELAGKSILAEKVSPSKTKKKELKYFGFINFTPLYETEKQRWPFTLNDVRESLGKSRNTAKARVKEEQDNNIPDENSPE